MTDPVLMKSISAGQATQVLTVPLMIQSNHDQGFNTVAHIIAPSAVSIQSKNHPDVIRGVVHDVEPSEACTQLNHELKVRVGIVAVKI